MIAHWIVLLLLLWAGSSVGLDCYNCRCPRGNLTGCACTEIIEAPQGSHCTIVEDLYSNEPYVELGSSTLNSSDVLIKDPYYIRLEESISYNENSTTWSLQAKRVIFGCDWDRCNPNSLIESLPRTFQLNIDDTWLTTNIYGDGSITQCPTCSGEVCVDQGNPISFDLCPPQTCENSTTVILQRRKHSHFVINLCFSLLSSAPCIISGTIELSLRHVFHHRVNKISCQTSSLTKIHQHTK